MLNHNVSCSLLLLLMCYYQTDVYSSVHFLISLALISYLKLFEGEVTSLLTAALGECLLAHSSFRLDIKLIS